VIIPDEKIGEVEKFFRVIHDYKAEAKAANSSATETFTHVAELLDVEQTKASKKKWKKIVKKAFKEWLDRVIGDTTSNEATEIASRITKTS
jgi:hypothetical protein